MSEPVFLTALVIVGTTLVLVAGAIGGALRGVDHRDARYSQLSWRSFTNGSTSPSVCWPRVEIGLH